MFQTSPELSDTARSRAIWHESMVDTDRSQMVDGSFDGSSEDPKPTGPWDQRRGTIISTGELCNDLSRRCSIEIQFRRSVADLEQGTRCSTYRFDFSSAGVAHYGRTAFNLSRSSRPPTPIRCSPGSLLLSPFIRPLNPRLQSTALCPKKAAKPLTLSD